LIKIVKKVRKIRKEIDSEFKDWETIERYFKKNQKRHKTKLYKGKPNYLPIRHIA